MCCRRGAVERRYARMRNTNVMLSCSPQCWACLQNNTQYLIQNHRSQPAIPINFPLISDSPQVPRAHHPPAPYPASARLPVHSPPSTAAPHTAHTSSDPPRHNAGSCPTNPTYPQSTVKSSPRAPKTVSTPTPTSTPSQHRTDARGNSCAGSGSSSRR